jgi:hypothetical protein
MWYRVDVLPTHVEILANAVQVARNIIYNFQRAFHRAAH